MEARKQYLVEQSNSMASSAAAAAAAGAAGGYPTVDGIKLNRVTYPIYKKRKFTVPYVGSADLSVRPFGEALRTTMQSSYQQKGIFNGKPYYEIVARYPGKFDNRFIFWNLPNVDGNGDPINNIYVGPNNTVAHTIDGFGWVMGNRLANIFSVKDGVIDRNDWNITFDKIKYVPLYSGTNGDKADGKGDYFLGKGNKPKSDATSTGWKFSTTGYTAYSLTKPGVQPVDPVTPEDELPGIVRFTYEVEIDDGRSKTIREVVKLCKLIKSTDQNRSGGTIGAPATIYLYHDQIPAYPCYADFASALLSTPGKEDLVNDPGTMLYHQDDRWLLVDAQINRNTLPISVNLIPEAFCEGNDYTDVSAWKADPTDSTADSVFVRMVSVETTFADNNPWGVWKPSQLCFKTLTHNLSGTGDVQNVVWIYNDGRSDVNEIAWSGTNWVYRNVANPASIYDNGPSTPDNPIGVYTGGKGETNTPVIGGC